MKIGFIGLGIMGKPMLKKLLRAGCSLMVNDLNPSAVSELAAEGAQPGTYSRIGAECEIVFLSVPTGAVTKEILFGENGAAGTLRPGSVVCDFSSVTPTESRECGEELRKIGVSFMDAPVSGGEPGAVAGTLAIMAGGDEKTPRKGITNVQPSLHIYRI